MINRKPTRYPPPECPDFSDCLQVYRSETACSVDSLAPAQQTPAWLPQPVHLQPPTLGLYLTPTRLALDAIACCIHASTINSPTGPAVHLAINPT